MKTDPELKSLFNKVRTKLGSPFREAASLLQDAQLCELLEMCVEDYAKLVQNWLIENQWSSIYGKDITTTDMAFALSVRSFDYLKDYSYWFSKEVGLQQRGPWELKKDFITVEQGKQSYIIPSGREINKVSKIKDLFITTTFSEGKCYCYLYYKAKEIEGEYRNASFSTSREKLLKEYNLALFEVISNFVLWLKSNPEAERDLEYETRYIVLNEDNSNTVYLERKENNIDSYPRENVQEIN